MLEDLNSFFDKKEGIVPLTGVNEEKEDVVPESSVSKDIKSNGVCTYNSIGSEVGGVPSVSGVSSESDTVREMKVQDFFKRVERCGINLDELRGVLNCRETMEIVSGAGSGKTTALVLKIIFDIVTGDCTKTVVIPSASGGTALSVVPNILVTTFLKSGAEELSRSFNTWVAKLGYSIDTSKIKFKTLHAEVYSALQGLGIEMNMATDNTSTYRTIMKNMSIRNHTSASRSISLEEIRDVECIMAYVRNRLDGEKYKHPLMEDYALNKELVDIFLKQAKVYRRSSGSLDFEDMQELLIEGVKSNPVILKYVQSRYDYIYCDEFQDTSQLQYQLLQYYFSGVKKIVVIGDDDQCIYSWRGSDIKIITEYFEEDYSPKVFKLSTNYRCRGNILGAVIPSITMNKYRLNKSLCSYVAGGSLRIKHNFSVLDLIGEIKKACEVGSVGVLSRTNNDLLVPALALELSGDIDFTLSKSVGLHNKLPYTIFGIIKLLTRNYDPSFEEYFNIFLPYHARRESIVLNDILLTNKDKTLLTISQEDLEYSVPVLWKNFIKPLRSFISPENGGLSVKAYLDLLMWFEVQYDGDSVYCRRARELIRFLYDFVSERWEDSLLKLDTFITKTLPERLSNRIASSGSKSNSSVTPKVKLTTVHEAKGKEWDSVFIWNDIEGVFPATSEKRSLTKEEMEEERRVHYIAWTRARNALTVYTYRGRTSRFLKECDIPDECIIKASAVTKILSNANKSELPPTEAIVQACLNDEPDMLEQYSIDPSFSEVVKDLVNNVGYDLAIKHLEKVLNIKDENSETEKSV